jgi:hypothetical protein
MTSPRRVARRYAFVVKSIAALLRYLQKEDWGQQCDKGGFDGTSAVASLSFLLGHVVPVALVSSSGS